METQFVPYEFAVKLKELGFDEATLGSYIQYHFYSFDCERSGKTFTMNEDNPVKLYIGRYVNDFGRPETKLCSAPLWQQAFDWFRNENKLYGVVDWWNDFTYEIYSEGDLSTYFHNIRHRDDDFFGTHEEAREQCLIKLIELCEKKQ